MRTIDEEIARHLQHALDSGELTRAEGFGKPLPPDTGWNSTPEALRMPMKILKNAGVVPAEVAMFNERAALAAALRACVDADERKRLQRRLSELEQSLALRLEALRNSSEL